MSRSVLVVDDHSIFRARACKLVEAAGYAVIGHAADAAGAISETRRLQPDVVLLDVQLPDGDGFSVAAELRSAPRAPRVILVSSREAVDYGSRLDDAPVVGFIHKPDLSRDSLWRLVGRPASRE